MRVRERAFAGHRLDAAYAGGDAGFGHDLEVADVAGARDVRAAAKLGREVAHAEHAHLVAVLLAEQRHRTGLDRVVVFHEPRLDRVVGADRAVDQRFDGADFLSVIGCGCEKSKRVRSASTSEPFCCT